MGQSRQYVHGLKRVLEAHVPASARQKVQDIKARGIRLFAPELGGRSVITSTASGEEITCKLLLPLLL